MKPKDLELTIVATSPAKLEIGSDFTATLRLKNSGSKPVLVPSVADGESVVRTPPAEATEEKYEVGDVSFRLATGKQRNTPAFLDSAGALFADPADATSYISLASGNWIEMKLNGTVVCAEKCLSEIQADNQATLSAWWYQRVLTHRVSGCDESHGSREVLEVDSAPFTVVVEDSSPKSSAVAWKQ